MHTVESALRDLGRLDLLAAGDSPIHRLDPRTKVITALAFIVAVVSFDRYAVSDLVPLLLYPLVILYAARLAPGILLRRLLWAAPFPLLLGMFNPLFDHTPIMVFAGIQFTGGWMSFFSILLRFFLTLTAALLLISTTPFPMICLALNRLRVPRVFTVQLLLLHRYFFVLADEATRMRRAWASRAGLHRSLSPRLFAALATQLLLRALDRAHRIHSAMLSRGFTGDFHADRPLRFGGTDAVFAGAFFLFFLVARLGHPVQWLGQWLLGITG